MNPIGAIEQVNTTGSEFETLQNAGVQVYAHNVSPDLHHKYAIVDHASPNLDPVVITGSHNWSSSAENVNDENTVIVHDARIANLYHQEFRGMLINLGVISSVEVEEDAPFTVFPNPTGNVLFLRWKDAAAGTRLTVRDMRGRVVHQAATTALGADLSVAGWTGGLYLLEVQGSAPVRFVVE